LSEHEVPRFRHKVVRERTLKDSPTLCSVKRIAWQHHPQGAGHHTDNLAYDTINDRYRRLSEGFNATEDFQGVILWWNFDSHVRAEPRVLQSDVLLSV